MRSPIYHLLVVARLAVAVGLIGCAGAHQAWTIKVPPFDEQVANDAFEVLTLHHAGETGRAAERLQELPAGVRTQLLHAWLTVSEDPSILEERWVEALVDVEAPPSRWIAANELPASASLEECEDGLKFARKLSRDSVATADAAIRVRAVMMRYMFEHGRCIPR